MSKPIFFIFCVLFLLIGCNSKDKSVETIAKIPLDLKVSRFDVDFSTAKAQDIPKLKANYPYLFPEQYADSVWIAKMEDTLQIALAEEVAKVFPDFDEEEKLNSLFKHIKYYFPRYKVPHVVTLISDVDYNNRVILADSLLLIGLDNYLGKDHHFYKGIQNYIAFDFDKRFLASNVASAFAKGEISAPRSRSFLARMVFYGKELYAKDKLLPLETDEVKIGYSQEELTWAKANEEQIWRNFIENELLYSTDGKLDARFLDPAPFSKFRLELDADSPGRIGRYIGWQIVRKFAQQNPKLSLQQIMKIPADQIFKESNYKPQK